MYDYTILFRHILIAFGGLSGLEAALESDESLRISDIRSLFDHYINTCPEQGSRIIRTEVCIAIVIIVTNVCFII